MLKNKSIIFSARFVGIIAAILLILSTILAINLSVFLDKRNEVHRAVMLYDLLFMQNPNDKEFNSYINKHNLIRINTNEIKKLKQKATYLIEDKLFRQTLQSGDIEIFVYNKHYYYAYKMDEMHYYRSEEKVTPYIVYIFLLSFFVLILLFILFKFISSSVKPLKELYIQIKRFANGEKDILIDVQGNDEVANVANAFKESVQKTQDLQNNKSLFLRNIMHELKTPISKGRLLVHFLENNNDKIKFENIFEQMQVHLDDLVNIELLTEKNMKLNLNTYSIVDILDHAIDKLEINKKDLLINITNTPVTVDFNIFAYAIKNLLDNAIKYTTSKPIQVNFSNNCLCISNYGHEFTDDISNYLNAYKRDLAQHSIEGMGLGLYIVNEIIKKHKFKLSYSYQDGKHNFCICF